jgi:Leucine-rich repeat (LRR) protein
MYLLALSGPFKVIAQFSLSFVCSSPQFSLSEQLKHDLEKDATDPENAFNHERVGKNFFLSWWIDYYMQGTEDEDFYEAEESVASSSHAHSSNAGAHSSTWSHLYPEIAPASAARPYQTTQSAQKYLLVEGSETDDDAAVRQKNLTTDRVLSDDAQNLHERFCNMKQQGATKALVDPASSSPETVEWKATTVEPTYVAADLSKMKKKELASLVKKTGLHHHGVKPKSKAEKLVAALADFYELEAEVANRRIKGHQVKPSFARVADRICRNDYTLTSALLSLQGITDDVLDTLAPHIAAKTAPQFKLIDLSLNAISNDELVCRSITGQTSLESLYLDGNRLCSCANIVRSLVHNAEHVDCPTEDEDDRQLPIHTLADLQAMKKKDLILLLEVEADLDCSKKQKHSKLAQALSDHYMDVAEKANQELAKARLALQVVPPNDIIGSPSPVKGNILKCLSMGRNALQSIPIELNSLLRPGSKLTKLILRDNKLSAASLRSFCEQGLRLNKSLRHLDLSGNPLGDVGGAMIAKSFVKNEEDWRHIRANLPGKLENGLEMLFTPASGGSGGTGNEWNAGSGNISLTTLRLEKCNLTDAAASLFASTIFHQKRQSSSTIRSIYASSEPANRNGEVTEDTRSRRQLDEERRLREAKFNESRGLQYVHFDGNDITVAGYLMLVQNMQTKAQHEQVPPSKHKKQSGAVAELSSDITLQLQLEQPLKLQEFDLDSTEIVPNNRVKNVSLKRTKISPLPSAVSHPIGHSLFSA